MYQKPKGVFDVVPAFGAAEEQWRASELWQHIEVMIRSHAELYQFLEIRTPVFESTDLFCRSVGEATDIVNKEMYTFEDRAGRSLSLRPEGTACAVRALLENGLHTLRPTCRLFYIAPMFRYERAQAGRYRQHHQFGCEAFGERSPHIEAEIIALLASLYRKLGITDFTLHLNSLGSKLARERYRHALIDFLKPLEGSLSKESSQRLDQNPLRILDSKDETDQKLLQGAPHIDLFWEDSDRRHHETLQDLLSALGIAYKLNTRLVRGLDYYNNTVFEFTYTGLGAQSTFGGGGRYDTLVKTLGGPDLAAFGFGSGIERIALTMLAHNKNALAKSPLAFILPLEEAALRPSLELIERLRAHNISSQMSFKPQKVGKGLQTADKFGATFALLIGETERLSQTITIKHLQSGSQQTLDQTTCISYIKNYDNVHSNT